MKKLSVALALLGILAATLLVALFGFGRVVDGIAQVGWSEFAVILLWQLVLFVILGLAWDSIVPQHPARRIWVLVWGRMVRDCSTNVLPFAQVGGFVFGARAVTLHGVSWELATASTVVDVTAEFLAELAFTGIGLAILLARAPDSTLAVPVEVGLAVAIIGAIGLVWAQRGAAPLFARVSERIVGRWFADARDRIDVLKSEMSLIYEHTFRLAVGFTMHLLGWIGTGVAGWIAYRAVGVPIDFDDALGIEALLSAVAALAFLVPVNAGVQEAGYAGLGAIFGVPPELSLAVSLIRRARDIAIGVPVLLVWQFVEVRRWRANRQIEDAG